MSTPRATIPLPKVEREGICAQRMSPRRSVCVEGEKYLCVGSVEEGDEVIQGERPRTRTAEETRRPGGSRGRGTVFISKTGRVAHPSNCSYSASRWVS
jgi:hypothetical protein